MINSSSYDSFSTGTVALDISKTFGRVWHAGLLHKLKSYGISDQIFDLISSFLGKRRLWVFLVGKSSRVPEGSIVGPTLFLLHINDPPDDVIFNIVFYVYYTNVYPKCDQASDLWQQLKLTSELESDLRDTERGQEVAC